MLGGTVRQETVELAAGRQAQHGLAIGRGLADGWRCRRARQRDSASGEQHGEHRNPKEDEELEDACECGNNRESAAKRKSGAPVLGSSPEEVSPKP